ncbi:MAG TPA: type IV toxin-antitoxin system AbiEi family antitoxin [Mycobacteriales bacterium]|nr:type IV toxin-antitoxin system AbiEi family antitoxin [Mycobacteriales bacterium]
MHKLANGYYAVIPAASRGTRWAPSIEAAAYGIGASDYGPTAVVLMGLSAARLHGAIPRALAVAVAAVPKQRPDLELAGSAGHVIFVRRETDRLDAERAQTDLGTALITGVEQTVLDLAHRPDLGNVRDEAIEATISLLPRCDERTLQQLAVAQRKRAALARAREWADA